MCDVAGTFAVVGFTGLTLGNLLSVCNKGTNFGVSPFVCATLFSVLSSEFVSFLSSVDGLEDRFKRLGFKEK